MSGAEGEVEKPVLSNRQRRILRREITRRKAKEAEERRAQGLDQPPVREEYIPPEVRHEDDRIIPGLTGRGTVQRLDTLAKLYEGGKISAAQYSAGRDYLRIVENYFATASGLAKLTDEAGRVGGASDPIRFYVQARPMWKGYVPTQRPRNPSCARAHSDGWSRSKLEAMSEFSRIARLVAGLERQHRVALCVLVIDPNRPDFPPLSVGSACRRLFGSDRGRNYAILTRWLCRALDAIDAEIMAENRIAA